PPCHLTRESRETERSILSGREKKERDGLKGRPLSQGQRSPRDAQRRIESHARGLRPERVSRGVGPHAIRKRQNLYLKLSCQIRMNPAWMSTRPKLDRFAALIEG